jgi:hypothetical protein
MSRRKPTYHDDLEEVMQNAYGRRFLQRLFEEGGIWNSPYVKGDPYETARQAGAKEWAIRLYYEVMTQHSDLFQIMFQEQAAKRSEDEKVLDTTKESE